MRASWKRVALGAGALGWSLAVAAVLHAVFTFETTPGEAGATPARWPAASTLAATAPLTIVMFVHADCICTQASLDELARVLAPPGAPAVDIVFAPGGHSTANWERAGRIARARRVRDDGSEARRFGARTSGFVVAYRDGALQFAGGITAARGHAGANVGSEMLARIVRASIGTPFERRVFGCALESA